MVPPASTSHETLIALGVGRMVSHAEFLSDALALAARLPQTGHVFNLCKDRYWFSVALFAAISRGIVNLLQNSTAPKNMAALFADFPDAICVGEEDAPDAGRPAQDNLGWRRDRDPPGAGSKLAFEQLRSEGRLAVGRQLHAMDGAPGRHRRDVVVERGALEDHQRRAEGPVEEVVRLAD